MGSETNEQLFAAVQAADTDAIDAALEEGADLEAKDGGGRTALETAAANHQLDVVLHLCSLGATVSHDAIAVAGRSMALPPIRDTVVKTLRTFQEQQTGEPSTPHPSEMFDAAWGGDADTVRACLEAGVPVDVETGPAPGEGETALSLAARAGNLEVAKVLVEKGADPNAGDEGGRSPLMKAAYDGRLEIVRVLLDAGGDPNRTSDADLNAVDYACKNGQGEVAGLLSERGGKLSDTATVMMFACDSGDLEIARMALEQGADLSHANEYGMTPLIQAAWRGHMDIARLLVEKGADVNLKPGRMSALQLAASAGKDDMVAFLEEHGAKSE